MNEAADRYRVLGLDPGTLVVGWGVVDRAAGCDRLEAVEYGTIRLSQDTSLPERLKTIHLGVAEVIERHAPAAVAVEEVFFGKSAKSELRIGEGRAACVLAAALRDLPIHGYPPALVKRAIAGNGAAAKEQVRRMVMLELALEAPPAQDASDALALAMTLQHRMRGGAPAVERPRRRRRRSRNWTITDVADRGLEVISDE